MARGQATRRSIGHYEIGARRGDGEVVIGTITKFHRTGSLAEGEVQIEGGTLETLSFDFYDLKVGRRIQFMRRFDSTRRQGARAVNVKLL